MRIDAGEASIVLTDSPILERVFNAFSAVGGGFTAWREAGGAIEKVEPKKPKA